MTEPTSTPSQLLRQDVVAGLATSGTLVRGIVVSRLVQAEIDRRADAVGRLIDHVANKEKELKKAEAQGTVTFVLGGNTAGEPTFTKQQIEDMNKIRQEITNTQTALDTAFATSDFKKVLEIAGKVGNKVSTSTQE